MIPERFHAASERYFVSSGTLLTRSTHACSTCTHTCVYATLRCVLVLVFAIPNDGSYALYNAHELAGKIAVFTRGKVSVAHKARVAQRAGAVAALIMDSSECDPDTMHCHRTVSVSPLLQAHSDSDSHSDRRRRHGRGWRRFDNDAASAWLNVQIPVAMVSADDAERIRSFMDLVTVDVNGELNYLVGV